MLGFPKGHVRSTWPVSWATGQLLALGCLMGMAVALLFWVLVVDFALEEVSGSELFMQVRHIACGAAQARREGGFAAGPL